MKIAIVLCLIGAALASEQKFGVTKNHIEIKFDPNSRIVGGSSASPGEFPWQVSMQINPASGARYHTCGGSILDSTHIVTAAHCVVGQSVSQVQIVAGAHNVKNENEASQQRVNVRRLTYNPSYNGNTISHDSAMITLASPLTFNNNVRAIPLAAANQEATGSCVNTGWGNSNPTGGSPVIVPDALQKVSLNIVARDTCRQMYSGINNIDASMVCANAGPIQGACNGDSGGPLVCTSNGSQYLAGIVSWGMQPCGQTRYPSVFGNISNMRAWLDQEAARP